MIGLISSQARQNNLSLYVKLHSRDPDLYSFSLYFLEQLRQVDIKKPDGGMMIYPSTIPLVIICVDARELAPAEGAKEGATGQRSRKVEQAVIQTWGVSNEHAL